MRFAWTTTTGKPRTNEKTSCVARITRRLNLCVRGLLEMARAVLSPAPDAGHFVHLLLGVKALRTPAPVHSSIFVPRELSQALAHLVRVDRQRGRSPWEYWRRRLRYPWRRRARALCSSALNHSLGAGPGPSKPLGVYCRAREDPLRIRNGSRLDCFPQGRCGCNRAPHDGLLQRCERRIPILLWPYGDFVLKVAKRETEGVRADR